MSDKCLGRQADMLVIRRPDHPVVSRHPVLVAVVGREERLRGRRRLDCGCRPPADPAGFPCSASTLEARP